MPGIKGDIEKSLGETEGTASGVGQSSGNAFGSAFSGAVAGAFATVTATAINMVSGAIDGAISRVDTLNNFPKVMENLGYSGEDAAASIDKISENLTGLPTSLDQMAGTVQQLAPLTGGLDEATNLSLALNNALLAGGKPMDQQANAMEQYSQMLATGTVDMAAWRSMVSAMPGQMDQLAQSLLGAEAGQMDLYDAMQNGTVSFDEFNAAIVDLNDNGTGAFASFEEQARSSTDGIATSQANLQTAVTRGLADVIQELKPFIDAVTVGLTDAVGIAFDAISGFIGWVGDNKDWLTPLAISVGVFTAGMVAMNAAATVAAAGGLAKWFAATKAGTAIQAAFNLVMNANPIMLVVTAIAALVAGLVWFFTQTEAGKAAWEAITQAIGVALEWLGGLFTTIFDAIGTAATWLWETILQPVFTAIGAIFTWIWENIISPTITNWLIAFGLLAAAGEWLWVNALQPAFDGIGAAFTWLWENVILPVGDFIKGVFTALGDAANWLWVNAIQPALAGIGAVFTWLYESIIKPVFDAVAAAFNWVYESIILPVTNFIRDAITNVGNTVRDVFGGIGEFIGNAFQTALDIVKGPINALIDLINGVIAGLNSISVDIPDWVPGVGGQQWGLNIPTIPRLAEGGIVQARPGGILANVGEGRYDEAVIPLSPAILGKLGAGQGATVNVYPQPGMSEEMIGRSAARHIATATRRFA